MISLSELRDSSIRERFILASIALFPLLSVYWSSSYTVLMVLVLLAGLKEIRLGFSSLTQEEKVVLTGFALLCLVFALSLVNTNDMSYGLRRLEKYIRFLFFIPFYCVLKGQRFKLKAIGFGLVYSAPFVLSYALYQKFYLEIGRVQGNTHNPIIFGDICALYSLLCLVLFIAYNTSSKKNKIGYLLAGLSFVIASYLSGTRGAWIALPAVTLLLLVVEWRRLLKRPIIALSLLLAIVGATIGSAVVLSDKVVVIKQQIEQFSTSVDKDAHTSVGQRFEMWQLAVELWEQHPILGTGIGDFRWETTKQIENGNGRFLKPWGHAHSIYFEHLGMTGLLGLLTLIITLFVLPLYVVLAEKEHLAKKWGVIVVCGSFAIFGLTEYWIGRTQLLTTFLFMFGIFFSIESSDSNSDGGCL